VQLWYPAEPGTGRARAPYDWRTGSLLSAERWVATDAALDAQLATMQARYPVLLYFPGWDGKRVAYTAIVQDLASRGFIVAAIGYDSAGCALPSGVAASPRTTEMDFSSAAAFDWTVQVADTKITRVASSATRVLDALADLDRSDSHERFTGRLDLSRTGAIGHSLGGAIALQIAWLDPRIKAAVDLDGWLFDAAPIGWIRQSFLVIGSDGNASATDRPAAAGPQRRYTSILDDETERRMHAAFARFGGVEVTIGASAHEDFSDAPYLSRAAVILNRRPDGHVIRIAVDCAVTFFESVFHGETSPSCETSNSNAQIVVWRRPMPGEPAN
jgi:dienelactone hydrolase